MSTDRDRLEQEAMNLLRRGQHDKALKLYSQLLREDPRDRRIRQKVAELLLEAGRTAEAERHFKEVAEGLMGGGQHRAAIAVFKQLVQMNANDPTLWGNLGVCYGRAGFPSDARSAFERASSLTRGDAAAAIKYAREIVRLAPGELPPRVAVAELTEKGSDVDAAIAEWRALAREADEAGRSADHARFAERALALRNDDRELLLDAARARLSTQEARKALLHLQPAYRADPKAVETLALLAQCFQSLGQLPKARQVWLQAARIYEAEDRVRERAHALERALQCGPDDGAIRAELGLAAEEAAKLDLRLDTQDWALPSTEAEVRLVIRAQVMARYGFVDRAIAELQDSNVTRRLPVAVALAELLVTSGETDQAGELLRTLTPPDAAAASQLATRLEVLGLGQGVADFDGEELVDDDPLTEPPLARAPAAAPATPSAPPAPGPDAPPPRKAPAGATAADGARLAAQGDVQGAIAAYRAVLAADPSDQDALIALAALMGGGPAPAAEPEPEPEPEPWPPSAEPGADVFGGGGTFAEVDPAAFDLGGGSEDDEAVFEARACLAVGMIDEAEATIDGSDGLEAEAVRAQIQRERFGAAAALEGIQLAFATASPNDFGYCEAAWVLAGLLVEAGQVAGASAVLDQLEQADPGFRASEVSILQRGLELLESR